MNELTPNEIAAIGAELTSLTDECEGLGAADLRELMSDAAANGELHSAAAFAVLLARLPADAE